MVGEFVAHDSKPPVLELESPAMTDLNMSGLAHARPQVRFRGEADMDRHAKSAGSVENDPLRTFVCWEVRVPIGRLVCVTHSCHCDQPIERHCGVYRVKVR